MGKIRKAAVLGAGVMGAAIAAHLANANIPTLLLDIVPGEPNEDEKKKGLDLQSPAVRNRFAAGGIAKALKAQPAAFSHKKNAKLVTPGNFEDDLDKLADVDWVVEAVVERMDIKVSLFEKVATHLKPGALLTTNTSGLSVNEMAAAIPEELKGRFFGTHFFNPPRYMHLLEIIPADTTDTAAMEEFAEFAEFSLGKGIVYAKDTINFIANRIGVFSMLYTGVAMEKHGLNIEAVDALTGKPFARPKSATYRTADLVGLDVLAHVAKNQYDGAPDDEHRDVFKLPAYLNKLLETGQLGMKSGGGFYKRAKDESGKKVTLVLDPATGEYRPKEKVKFPVLEELKQIDEPTKRVAALIRDKSAAGKFSWDVIAETLLYAARRIPAVSADVVSIDRALRWGFGWEVGPFEIWDGIGVKKSVEKMLADGRDVPEGVKALAASENPTFYIKNGLDTQVWNMVEQKHEELPARKNVTILSDLKAAGRVLYSNAEASIIDLGDRVACLEFHSKMNAIGGGIMTAIQKATSDNGLNYDALVVGNQGENFSVGANLMLILFVALEGELDAINAMVAAFQNGTMSLKYSPVPVVAAPFGRVLGGGAEVCLHSHRVQASLESYMGLVEVGVGLVPGGGGTKEFALRTMAGYPGSGADPFPFIRNAFETIAMAKVSFSAHEAQGLGFLRPGDRISMNAEHLIDDAKRSAIDLLESGWTPLVKETATIKALGRDGLGNFRSVLHNMKSGKFISEHDELVATKVATILCGGDIEAGTEVTEQYLLDLERRAFIELCAERKTLERIQHILKTGKPLRN
ncbi:MAG: 3-hydroxyacyl-CoA dehydrogenase [Deltaproteobacteria bacterium]|nr:MAG: 3-hydroxyacyl-CoA dehydrogenase [Deltaproteobacteria bacterium]